MGRGRGNWWEGGAVRPEQAGWYIKVRAFFFFFFIKKLLFLIFTV